MQTVHQLLNENCHSYVVPVSANTKINDAMQLMAEYDTETVIVMKNRNILGVFSERDYIKLIALNGLSSEAISVQEAMTNNVVCVNSDSTLTECMSIIANMHIAYLMIIENSNTIGVISIDDLASAIIDQQEETINYLVSYINDDLVF